MSYLEYQEALREADQRMKANNGHEFVTIIKTRCQHCGRSRNAKGKCGGWFQTFVNQLGCVLQERGVIKEEVGR